MILLAAEIDAGVDMVGFVSQLAVTAEAAEAAEAVGEVTDTLSEPFL
jgi:hypothetical protein